MRTKGISRKGVSEVFCQREREVSQLILESRLLQAQGYFDEATRRCAEAARREEVQCDICAVRANLVGNGVPQCLCA